MDNKWSIEAQESIELQYNKRLINQKVKEEILDNPAMVEKLNQGIELVKEYLNKEYTGSSNERIKQLASLDIEQLVLNIFTGIAQQFKPISLSELTGLLAGKLGWDDKYHSILTMGELLVVLCETDAYDIGMPKDTYQVISGIPLSEELIDRIHNSLYLPPMLCKPKELTHNRDCGYLTNMTDSVILKHYNHHSDDVCLDVLNLMNSVCLRLDVDLVSYQEEEPTFDWEANQENFAKWEASKSPDSFLEYLNKKKKSWETFKEQSYKFYALLATHGNEFYLTHKVDKRGRIYAQGYHLNTQGTAFKKATIELANQEIVDGVPPELML